MASLFLLPPPQMKVVVRIRPALPNEKKRGRDACVRILPSCPAQIQVDEQLFDVDRVYDEDVNQRDFFIKEFGHSIEQVFDGESITAFACGGANSGKTYTMEGIAKNPGLVPRMFKSLFQCGQQQVADFRVEISMFEILQNKVMDLLVSRVNQDELAVEQTNDGRVKVNGLTAKIFSKYDEFHGIYDRICKNRRKGNAALVYSRCNRGHFFLQAKVVSRGFDGEVNMGCLNLIDLASQDDVCPTVQESASMMLDLQPKDENQVSQLLSDIVKNSTHAVMVCNISPARAAIRDTLKSLQYTAKKKQLVATPEPVEEISTVELTPKAKPAATPTLDTTSPWTKRRDGNPIVPMKRLALQEPKKAPITRPKRLKVLPAPATSVFVPQPTEQDRVKHLLAMAVDFEKYGKGHTALALYKQALTLIPTSNSTLDTRIRVLEESLLNMPTELQDSRPPAPTTTSVRTNVQHILEADLLATLNHASMSKLLELQGVGEKKAAKIFEGRKHVQYTTLRDLVKIGMGEKQVMRFHHLNVALRLSPL